MILNTKTRNKAHQYFLKKGLPSKKDESWKYTSLKKLTDQDLIPAANSGKSNPKVLEQFRHSAFHQIFVFNGELYARKSDQKVFAKSLKISKNSRAVGLQLLNARKETGKIRQESLEALNTTYSRSVDLVVKSGTSLKKPLQIIFYSKEAGATYPRIRMILEKNAQLNLVDAYYGDKNKHFTDAMTEILVSESANLKYLRVQSESKQSIHFGCTRIFLKENAQLESLIYASGAEISRHNLDIHCLGPGANAIVNGLTLGGGEQHFDNSTRIDHVVGQCNTQQLYKSLLAGKSKAVFRGQVEIREGAQKAFSDQLNKNLLLSKEAEADSIPQLNIYADDVKATHGSTVGQISEEEIFYLLSRAIERDKALELLSLGFVQDLVDRLTVPEVRQWLQKNLEASYREIQ